MDNLTGKNVRGYVLREKLGEGGFGAVYKAFQESVEREVAIKIIRAEYSNQPEFIRRFEAEAQIIARLEHIHIIPLYDYWRDPDGAYLIMRWLSGGNVRQTFRQGPWELDAVVRLVNQMSAALHIAHRRGIVHRDIKPENILIDMSNNYFLTDFGIAIDTVDSQTVTQENISFGSPAYISPEQITSGEVTPMADIYGLGILIYELLTGDLPFDMPTQTQFLKSHVFTPVPSLKAKRPDLPSKLDNVIWQATSKSPSARYTNTLVLAEALRKAVGIEIPTAKSSLKGKKPSTLYAQPVTDMSTVDLSTRSLKSSTEPQNPYKGLRAFEESDAGDFCGRDDVIQDLLAKMAKPDNNRFLAVVGPSGSGKSSLVKAGLLPALRRGQIENSGSWFIATFTPGNDPLQALADALLQVAAKSPDNLLPRLSKNAAGLSEVVKTILPEATDPLLLVIDQFEEVFTLLEYPQKRDHFLRMLHHAVTEPEGTIRIIITLRADYYDRPLLHPAFGSLIREHTEVVLPLGIPAIEQAVISPAVRAGLTIEPGLSTLIANDVGNQPGALPLLQYALTELYEHRDDGQLTLEAYKDIGGISGALARRAEETYAALDPAHQALARQLFLRLIALGEQAQATRRRVLWGDVVSIGEQQEAMQTVINQFGHYRLLTFDRDATTRSPTIEVAHEALIREWLRLKEWIDESRNQLRIQRQLSTAASEWSNANTDDSFLAAGSRLSQFESLLTEQSLVLNQQERDYIQHSITLREKSSRRMQIIAITFAVFSVIALALALFAFYKQDQAETATTRANQAAQIARSRELAAASQANLDQTDLALLLGNAAVNFADTSEARDSLLIALQNAPFLSYYLHGHDAPIRSLTFSPDGQSLLSGSRDGDMMRWDLTTKQTMGDPIPAHEGAVNSVAYSPDGRFFASGGADFTVRLWDAATNALLNMAAHDDAVWSVAFSPDSTLLASTGADNTIRLWDAQTGDRIGTPLRAHTDTIYSIAFTPDGTILASAGADNRIILWDVKTGEMVSDPLVGHSNWILALAFSPDGRYLLSSGVEPYIFVWDMTDHQLLGQISTGHTGWTRSLAFSSNGQVVASANTDSSIRLWQIATGSMIGQPLQAHKNEAWAVDFSPGGLLLASGGMDNSILIWDIESATAPASQRLAAANEITVVAISPDGQWVASGEGSDSAPSPEGVVQLWDTATGDLLHTMGGHGGPVTDVAFSSNGERLVSAGSEGTLLLWDTATGKLAGPPFIGHDAPIRRVVFMADDQTLISAGDDGRILFWDATTSKQYTITIPEQAEGVLSMALAPDEEHLVTGGRNGVLQLWDITTTAPEPETLAGHTDAITHLMFSRNGKMLISSSRDGTIILWDMTTLEPIGQPLTGHDDWVLSAALNPDESILASGSRDQHIILWDMATLRPIGVPLSGHLHWVQSVAFNPVDGTLISGSRDGTMLIWSMNIRTWQTFACQIANRHLTAAEQEQYLLDDLKTVAACP